MSAKDSYLNANRNGQEPAGATSSSGAPIPCPVEAKVAGILNIVLFGLAAAVSLLALVGAFTVEKRDGWIMLFLIASLVFSLLGLLLGIGLLLKHQRAYRFAVLHLTCGRVVAGFFLLVWIFKLSFTYPFEIGQAIVASLLLFAYAFCRLQMHLLNREQVYQQFQ